MGAVYNLTVADHHEYVAAGVFVHNTFRWGEDVRDQLSLALRNPDAEIRCLWTTTPRRVPLIRDEMQEAERQARLIATQGWYETVEWEQDTHEFVTMRRTEPSIVVQRWSTYDNLSNLSPAFAREIVARYEGTRIGRQELYGELLEDVGTLFQRAWFMDRLVDVVDGHWLGSDTNVVRAWDFAATPPTDSNPDPDWTVGTKLIVHRPSGTELVADVRRIRGTPMEVDQLVVQMAREDGPHCAVLLEEEGGSSGKRQSEHFRKLLAGQSRVIAGRPQGSKEERAGGKERLARAVGMKRTGPIEAEAGSVSSLAEQGRLHVVRGPWLSAWLDELEEFPNGPHDDQVDTLAMAHNWLMGHGRMTLKEPSGRLPVRETHIPRDEKMGRLGIPTMASRWR